MNRRIVVIKLGSNTLLNERGRLDLVYLDSVAGQVASVQSAGLQPVLVSSGAVACGMADIGLDVRPTGLSERQALAAIGQAQLMHHWRVALAGHGLAGAQILLTADDFTHRDRYLNLTAALRACFDYGAVPIINENDTVAVDELTVGENDHLSAVVASQLGAELLVLLTDIDGVYSADPRRVPDAERIEQIERVTPKLLAGAGDGGPLGRGGMRSKLLAARLAASAGVCTVIAHGRTPDLFARLLVGEVVGTRVHGDPAARADSRRRWLALARKQKGAITVDAGAARALTQKGRSLLPVGIAAISGGFKRGDTVSIVDAAGNELARGLAGLAADELDQIKGMRMDVAAKTLGYVLPKAAVHRDNLLLIE